ncbi:MAG: hypothetical protein M1831_004426 [Alyxoria varia]|nr:MAG: hypothetical protein M1831_004426 [Alyxoria varia]
MESQDRENVLGRRCEIRALQERYKKSGEVEVIAQDEYKPLEFDPDAEYALVAKNKFKSDGSFDKTVLTMNSPQLVSVLGKVMGRYASTPASFEQPPVEMESPFQDLLHHWDSLDKYREDVEDDTERMHLILLLQFMRGEMGDIMYTSERGHDWLLKLERTAYEESNTTGRRFEVHCTHTIQDGTQLRRCHKQIQIFEKKSLPGDTPGEITSLPIFPRRFYEDDQLEGRLEKRGQKCDSLRGILNMHYEGLSEYQKSPPKSYFHWTMDEFELIWLAFTEAGRVVVDCDTFFDEFGGERGSIIGNISEEYRDWAVGRFNGIDEANSVLATPYVYGYSLQKKQWCKFYVDNLREAEWKPQVIDSLVLPDRQKDILRALVTSHQFPTTSARDEAAQKGKGLVILLHGSPGSGKTLTAEASAEITRSALVKISLGEIFDNGYFDEEVLKMLLQWATTWKAIVLIDEADVFLEARTSGAKAAADRNGIVAVFLRHLEYFSGIAFLTSNRVEDFDLAVKSRIHLALQFSPPTLNLRWQIWREHLRSVPVAECSFNPHEEEELDDVLYEIVKDDMNGREIANTINSARTLARHNGKKLGVEQLKVMIESWREFNVALNQLGKKVETMGRQNSIVVASPGAR